MCSLIHLDVLWFSATFVHFELYADIFYFCFRSHFIYVTLLVIDLSIFSRHSEIFFWKKHQTAKDFHWIFAKLSLLCCASHNYKMRFQHKNVSKTHNICFCSWVQWRMAYISIFLFNFFFIFSLFLWQYTQMTEIQMICALFFALTWNESFSRIVMKSMREHRHQEFNWFMQSNCWSLFKFSFFIYEFLQKWFFFEMLQMLFVASTAQNIFAISWMTYLNSMGKTKKKRWRKFCDNF